MQHLDGAKKPLYRRLILKSRHNWSQNVLLGININFKISNQIGSAATFGSTKYL